MCLMMLALIHVCTTQSVCMPSSVAQVGSTVVASLVITEL